MERGIEGEMGKREPGGGGGGGRDDNYEYQQSSPLTCRHSKLVGTSRTVIRLAGANSTRWRIDTPIVTSCSGSMIAPMIHTITLIIRSNQRSKREDGDKRREREREGEIVRK